ncbi:alanine racemase [Stappia sp. 28M-7]|uniref:alanine racemase n=1 Tax=Stappia sp. 28M-7 TaxID=2762596 RepID=UPI00163BFAC2|nr:alanine racemase [Stappia sp. 28M-7]MBC2857484.1 alanine racemase [Stappia sp. 28M-7]
MREDGIHTASAEQGVGSPDLDLSPERGELALPVLTMDEAAFDANVEAMFDYVAKAGVSIAPHAKTPMSPELSRRLLDRGAWGLSVANLQQARVFLENGARRLLVANQIGGRRSAERFAALMQRFPDATLVFFADAPESLEVIAHVGRTAGRTVPVLVEVGAGRAGARSLDAACAVIDAASRLSHVELAGVAAYEGAAATADPQETVKAISALDALVCEVHALLRAAAPERALIVSAGGSSFFDLVVGDLKPLATRDGNTELVLRSGAIFFHDHGVYERALAAMDARAGFAGVTGVAALDAFRPALAVWAEVLSRPEPGLAICGMGMRDVSYDQDLPVPLAAWRDGVQTAGRDTLGSVVKLNDQHAFLRLPEGSGLGVGDIVAFGISHPCTCLDRWRVILGRGADGRIAAAYPTHFS